ncbi:MAG: hypothetical protein ACE366_05885 [Bradymonadia bacterium]
MRIVLIIACSLWLPLGCGGGQKAGTGEATAGKGEAPASQPADEDAPNPCAAAPGADEDAPPADEDAPNPCAGG